MVDFRNEIRNIGSQETVDKKALMKVSDSYRNALYEKYNIKIEDGTNVWKTVSGDNKGAKK